jgi:hypothetical protein
MLRRSRLSARTALASFALTLAAAALTAATAADMGELVLSPDDREALGRVAYAEAGNQQEEGLAAVTHAVLNRVASGRFGASVQAVLDAPGQFEPVTRAGGSWRDLPALTPSQRLVFATILDLILQGRLPDLTAGSTHFQNAAVVAQRAEAGQVSPNLVNFGGQMPAAVVRDHSFFRAGQAGQVAHQVPPSALGATAGVYHLVDGRLVRASSVPQGPEAPPVSRARLIRIDAGRVDAGHGRDARGGPGTHVRIFYGVSPARDP